MNIIFVTVADLPEGGGNTSRLRMLCRALVHAGHTVTIWNEHALGISSGESHTPEGEVDGVPFRYALGTTNRSSGLRVVLEKLRAVRVIGGWLEDACRRKAVDVLWFNNLSFYDTWWLTRMARGFGVATIQSYEDERHELVSQEGVSPSRRLFALNSSLGDKLCPSMADAVVVISRYLGQKYEALCGDPRKVHLVPTIIDCHEWQCFEKPESDPPVIFYAGAFGEQDEMEGLVDAFHLLKERGIPFRGVLLGGNSREPERFEKIRRKVEELGLSGHVQLPGFVGRSQVKEWMSSASVLVNIRRDGVWSRSGLSTKLSEYLASGRMVVATGVGDVGHYLKDGESALLFQPGVRPPEIAEALSRALGSADLRWRVGRGGWDVARKHFDLPVAARQLDDLLRTVVSSRKTTSAIAAS